VTRKCNQSREGRLIRVGKLQDGSPWGVKKKLIEVLKMLKDLSLHENGGKKNRNRRIGREGRKVMVQGPREPTNPIIPRVRGCCLGNPESYPVNVYAGGARAEADKVERGRNSTSEVIHSAKRKTEA